MDMKVSVIIPIYKTEEYLEKCLNSVLSQSLREIEVICINDGSPNGAQELLEKYSCDSRVVVINKENQGVGIARNDGIRLAKGEYIAFMDSDDFYPSTVVLERLYNKAKKNNAKIVGGYALSYKNNTVGDRIIAEGYGETEFKLNEGFNSFESFQYDYGFQFYIYQRSIIVNNKIEFPAYSRYQDPPFFVRIMHACEKFYYVNEPTYVYRLPEKELHVNAAKAVDMVQGMVSNLKFAEENNLPKLYYLTSMRLSKETKAVFEYLLSSKQEATPFLYSLIKANAGINDTYIEENGYDAQQFKPFEVFNYLINLAGKYYRIRNNPIIKLIK